MVNPVFKTLAPSPFLQQILNSSGANFSNWSKDPFQTKGSEIGKIIEACNQSTDSPAKKKAIEESRKLINTFSKNLATYPKPLTYEGSVVFCVAISVSDGTSVNLNGLPQIDKETIFSQLPPDANVKLSAGEASINVDFDEMRDFVLSYYTNKFDPIKLKYFNAVIHPQKLCDTNVPVEKEGGKVKVGTHLVLDQRRIAKLVGLTPSDKKEEEYDDPTHHRQPVSGRNAFELRSDLVQMSMDLLFHNNRHSEISPKEVVETAKLLYTFVENKR